MILGVDLTGEERERYEAVRAARIRMERDGVPSPFACCESSEYAHAPGVSQDKPKITFELAKWLLGRTVFEPAKAAKDLNVSISTIYAAYKYLKNNNLTSARLPGAGGKRR